MSELNYAEIWDQLKAPFPSDHIEWRVQQAGVKNKEVTWAKVLAYVSARPIMDRLDATVGPDNWKDDYKPIESSFFCHLSIRVNGEWITKVDGAEETNMEAFKGGISGSFKRAASKWGIGRYLYNLEEGWATIVAKGTKGARLGQHIDKKTKERTYFYWLPPALPGWALPEAERNVKKESKNPPEKAQKQGKFQMSQQQKKDLWEVMQKLALTPDDVGIQNIKSQSDYMDIFEQLSEKLADQMGGK